MVDEWVRVLRDSDVGAVVALSLRAWEPVFASFERQLGRRLFARLYPDWRAQQEESVRQALADNETWVSAEGDRVTGFVNVIFSVGDASAEIYMIAVDPAFQRRGIASALTGHALSEMRRRGITLATVATGGDPGHAPARRTYEKAGFTSFPQVLYSRVLAPDEP
ncbi:MAG TPA: GNAT family N-acetyltransferase [Jiangellales bacterium]|nr:GNAT family N-acetyltransferase [Jiangellales bacterium]